MHFVDEISNKSEKKMEFVYNRVENIVDIVQEGENVGYKHCLLFCKVVWVFSAKVIMQ